jgi:hypothetical protein
MNNLKKALIFFAPLILGVWATVSWAGIPEQPPISVSEPSVLLLLAGGLGVGALARYLRKRK